MSASNRKLKIILPLAAVAVAIVAMATMIKMKPAPETRIPEPPLPLVRVMDVQLQDMTPWSPEGCHATPGRFREEPLFGAYLNAIHY